MSPFAMDAIATTAALAFTGLAGVAFVQMGRRLTRIGERLDRLEEHASRIDRWVTAAETPGWLAGLRHDLADVKARLDEPASPKDVRHELAEIKALVALAPVIRGHVPHSEWALSPDALLPVLNMAAWEGLGRVLECGSGVSTIYFAALFAQRGHGHIISIDHDPAWASRTRHLLNELGLDRFATVVHAPLKLLRLAGEEFLWYDVEVVEASAPDRIDLLLVDGPPGGMCAMARYPALPILMPKLTENAAILLDDADRPDERRTAERWSEAFTLKVSRLDTRKGVVVLRRSPIIP